MPTRRFVDLVRVRIARGGGIKLRGRKRAPLGQGVTRDDRVRLLRI